jgi:hypothetical protein
MPNYQSIYAVLRAALVDRQRDTDDEIQEAVYVDIMGNEIALKKEVPSGALLLAYTMLYQSDFLSTDPAERNKFAYLQNWLGGSANPEYPLMPSEMLLAITTAVGIYANFFHFRKSPVNQLATIAPNYDNPLVVKTAELIQENDLTYYDAKEVLIELLQDEQYNTMVPPLADDFIANHTFIQDTIITLEQ